MVSGSTALSLCALRGGLSQRFFTLSIRNFPSIGVVKKAEPVRHGRMVCAVATGSTEKEVAG